MYSSSFVLVWQKINLPKSNVQQIKSGTAYPGSLKLTQTKWKINGTIIDQTTYFRQTTFDNST